MNECAICHCECEDICCSQKCHEELERLNTAVNQDDD
jgi:hypothetical protein